VYGAAVTMMMRVVFLLFAEQRGLLPQTDLFDRGYGLSGRLDALDQRFREEGAEALDGTHLTWHRLLGASRLLYQGSSAEDLRLPAYGGSLFDPDRYAFLTACTEQGTLAIKVSDRVMLEVLRAVEVARVRGEARRLSFRDIDVEQIGYIYEGLLGYTTHEVDQVVVGVVGTQGEEPEIPLEKLERLRATHSSDEALADAIREYVEETQPSAKPPTRAALARALRTQPDDADRALRAVVSDDEALRHRLRTFAGMIRRDLRDRPLVVRPGGVMVVETPSRKTAGAHYTPRSLAEDVVGHALEPLVFHPGPHQTSDRDAWRPISSDRILALKVADIACGSGAFLVAAARYLADRLVEAWQREGSARGLAHELRTKAIRQVVARCLYGADINAMAVEMCKLSLWLVSLDPKLPFSFVDDKILHGNSLLGLTDVRQLKARHIDPDAARIPPTLFDVDVDAVLDDAARLRRELASEVDEDDPQRSTAAKRRQLGDLKVATAQLTDIANAVVAAGLKLGGKPGRALNEAYENLRIALEDAYPADGSEPDRAMLDDILSAGLTPQVETDYERWQPLHWVLAVPDVMERGGFDAVVGNPPFRGGKKISGDLGSNMREWLVNVLAGGTKGNADLVAYFFLRAFALLNPTGILGLLGTNTLGQGDTREVGLDRMVADGFTVTRCVQSTSWPVRESATLEIALVWGTRGEVSDGAPRMADGLPVRGISTLLEPVGRVEGPPARLSENAGIAFIGCYVLGMGFVLSPDEASSWIEDDPRNADVLFPYLNGEDLNSRPDSSASRSVIDFNDWSEERAEKYALPFERVAQRVKPERQRRNSKGDFVLRRPLPSRWWQYADKRPALRRAITGLDEVLAIALVSKTVIPMRVPAGQVFSHRLGVFATGSFAEQGVLSSTQHWLWAVTRSSTLETRVNYSPSDAFLTFPRSEITAELSEVGRSLDTERRDVMLRRQLGLTSLYNLVNSPDVTGDRDVDRMRDIHVGLDEAVMAAYGWDDVPLDHGFHTYRQMRRWTVSPEARVEILDRLL
jgi:type I restriction-modification system DNA methylase subunit